VGNLLKQEENLPKKEHPFKLRFSEKELQHYAQQYDYGRTTENQSKADQLNKYYKICPVRGYLTEAEFQEMVKWKSERRLGLAENNSAALIKELTSFSFSAQHMRSKIGALLALEGVGMPVASVLLHFGCDATIPIIDERALWSLSHPKVSYYSFELWEQYLKFCRDLAIKSKLTVREVDKALWKYSEIHQDGLQKPNSAKSE
jgi:hypothetical protein